MPQTLLDRLARTARDPRCDLAEAALLVDAVLDPELDVDVALLRIDALADGLRTRGFSPADPDHDARALADYLAGERDFLGEAEDYYHPDNARLGRVLDARRGMPIVLSILYVAVARRLHVPAHTIALPGHVVAGIGNRDEAVIIDPFAGGARLGLQDIAALVDENTAGRMQFRSAMLRPAHPGMIVRRLLNNLTRDFAAHEDGDMALRTVEMKLELPGALPADHRDRGHLLMQLGRFDEAALAYNAYLERAEDPSDGAEVLRLSIRARAKLN